MQFTKLNGLLALLALPILAAATPWATPTTSVPITTTVTVTSTATSTAVPATARPARPSSAELGVLVDGLDVLLGVTCSPITVVGGVAGTCSASPVCCENNNFNGVVAVGCVPVTL
ncbi:fungal hydrophobin [Phellopilus nigrolimitatus]|nr:fungal hydrophobin [Phellopilus nigrolimitatus]